MAERRESKSNASAPLAALFAWMLPGLGHWWIGERKRAIIFFVVTSVTFWGGVAVGGVRSSVTLRDNGPWIAAQLCMGPQALIALQWSNRLASIEARQGVNFKAPWPASDIGVVYAGVAGLLNLLIILDALARVDRTAPSTSSRAPPMRKGGDR